MGKLDDIEKLMAHMSKADREAFEAELSLLALRYSTSTLSPTQEVELRALSEQPLKLVSEIEVDSFFAKHGVLR